MVSSSGSAIVQIAWLHSVAGSFEAVLSRVHVDLCCFDIVAEAVAGIRAGRTKVAGQADADAAVVRVAAVLQATDPEVTVARSEPASRLGLSEFACCYES